MKRRISFILALLILAGSMSCGSGSGDKTQDTTASDTTTSGETTAEEVLTDGVPDIDMDGFVFSVFHNNPTQMTWTNLTLDVAEPNGEVLNDAIYNRNRKIEDRFNCKIETTEFTEFQIGAKEISQEVMAGESNYDVWFPRDYNIPASIPYLRPLNDLPYVNLDADWWFPNASDVFRFNGVQYGATSYFSLSQVSRAAALDFNKDIYETIGAEKTPYEYVRDNEWTLDTFASVAKLGYSDLNGNARIDEGDRFGMGSGWREVYMRYILGSGVNFISRDDKGYPVFDLPGNQGAIDKMLHIFDLFNDKQIYNNPSKSNPDSVAYGTFQEGNVLFVIGHPFNMSVTYRELDANIGFVPCPKYDSEQERYYSPTYAGEMMAILKTLPDERLENVSAILEALSFSGMHDVLPIYREVTMKGKSARDLESEEMFDIVLDSMSFDFGLIAWEGDVVNPIIMGIYASGNGDVVSTFAKLSNKINGVVDKLVESIEAEQAS